MNESNTEVSLLQEIRDNQAKQTEAIVQVVEELQATQKAYRESSKEYQQSQAEYRKTQQIQRKTAPVLAGILGVIALCMLADLILRLMGK
jgi:phage-related tail protein